MACVCSFCCKLCFTQFLQSHCSCSKVLSPSSCSTMSFVFNFYQYGDAITTPPRPRPKTAARPPSALLPPGDWSEPTRRRRRDDPANAGGRRERSHSPRHRRRRHSRSPRRRAAGPAPKSISGLTLRTFAQSLLSAKVSVKEHFVSAASYNVPNVNSCMYFFKVKDFPGPPPTPGQAYAWAHCSDQKGTVGILSMGRVLRTAAYTLGLSEDQEAMSFFGRVHTNPTWTDNFVEWCANLTWSTKNSSGIVFGGYLSGNVSKSPSANTQLESSLRRLHPAVHSISRDKRWAIRECAARIDFICVVADSASADFPSPPVLQRIADAVAQRRIEDGEAWGSHWPADR